MSSKQHQRFSLYYRNGYAVLRVFPPSSPDEKVYAEEIVNRMKLLQIPMVRMKTIDDIIERADGSREKLIEWPAGVHLSPHINIRISEDLMLVEVFIDPPKIGGGIVTREQFEHLMDDNGISSGIDWDRITACTDNECYNAWIPIANGRPPVHGRGGRVKYNFSTDTGKPFRELPHGRIDLKELNFIQFRRKGDLLAEREAPVLPQDGYDVRGNAVSANPMDEEDPLVSGEMTELRDEGIYALEDGNVRLDRGAVVIEPVVTVNNVDYETGNLDFEGSIIVKGTVADGFHIKASGDIQIGKSVGRVLIESGRNVILQAGINGDKEGKVKADGDIYTRFAESAFLESTGSLIVTGAILHSTIKVSGHLLLEGGRGEILGGLAIVRGWVKCRKIGSLYETKTNLIVGVEPHELEEFLDLLKELDDLRDQQDNIDKQIRYYNKKRNQNGSVPKLSIHIQILEKELKVISSRIEEHARRIKKIRKTLEPDSECFVLAEDMIYSGARVSFGLFEFAPDQRGARKTILQFREGRIRETGYNPAQMPEEIARQLPRDET